MPAYFACLRHPDTLYCRCIDLSTFEQIPSISQRTIKTPFSVIGSPPGIIFCASRALAGAFCCDLERPRLQRGAAVTACTPAAPVISNGEKLHFFRVSACGSLHNSRDYLPLAALGTARKPSVTQQIASNPGITPGQVLNNGGCSAGPPPGLSWLYRLPVNAVFLCPLAGILEGKRKTPRNTGGGLNLPRLKRHR